MSFNHVVAAHLAQASFLVQERVIGQDHHVHAHPHDHIARALPKGAIADRPGGEGWVQGKAGPICDSTTFEVTGDRTVDKVCLNPLHAKQEVCAWVVSKKPYASCNQQGGVKLTR